MSAETVAKAFMAWAIQNGLVAAENLMAGAIQVPANAALPAIPAGAVDVFREKGISYVGFNDAANEVVIYTARAIAKKVQKLLPQSAQGNIVFTYRVGAPAVAGKPQNASVGAPATLHNGAYACGSSIHIANRVGAGTLGCLVKDANGQLYGLTNSHVTANCNYAAPGVPVLAPGPLDIVSNGIDPFCIGHHASALMMTIGTPEALNGAHLSNFDAALFKIKDVSQVSSVQRLAGYDTPTLTAAIAPGMTVSKVGRTTGLTHGLVRAQSASAVGVGYRMPDQDISMVIFYEPAFAVEATSGFFSRSGDSGSLVTWLNPQDNNRYAVGLLFAGDDKKVSFVLPIEPIVQKLGVTLVSNHNV
jgi:hypothetical protein